jgi:hypothetical protein
MPGVPFLARRMAELDFPRSGSLDESSRWNGRHIKHFQSLEERVAEEAKAIVCGSPLTPTRHATRCPQQKSPTA